MPAITFHSLEQSPFLWAAILAADEKGVAYDLAPVELGSPAHLALHPFGKIPILQHGDVFIYETAAIVHYIDRAFEGPPLQPADARGQAEVLRWISIVNAYIFPTMNRFMKERLVHPLWGVAVDQAFIAAAQAPLTLQMRLIEEAVARTDHLTASAFSLADIYLLPHLLFFLETPEGAALLAKSPAIIAWLARMRARASFARNPMTATLAAMQDLPRPPRVWDA